MLFRITIKWFSTAAGVGGYVKKFSLFCEILTTYSVLFAFFIVSHFKILNYLFLERGPHGLDIRKEKGDYRIVIAIKAKTPFKVLFSFFGFFGFFQMGSDPKNIFLQLVSNLIKKYIWDCKCRFGLPNLEHGKDFVVEEIDRIILQNTKMRKTYVASGFDIHRE